MGRQVTHRIFRSCNEGGLTRTGFSNDPYLAGELVYETITGIQESVIACVKHFILNEQETNRNPPLIDPTSFNVSISSNVDDKTMHELYLWPFQDAVYAGAGSVMCSYNQINGSYGCQNSKTLNGLLKEELGFQGFVLLPHLFINMLFTNQIDGSRSSQIGVHNALVLQQPGLVLTW